MLMLVAGIRLNFVVQMGVEVGDLIMAGIRLNLVVLQMVVVVGD